MNRKGKIDLIKGVLRGKISPSELGPPKIAIGIEGPETGELIPWGGSGNTPDPETLARNTDLLKRATTDPSITVIRIVYQ